MPRPSIPRLRAEEYAWLITAPLLVLAVAVNLPVIVMSPVPWDRNLGFVPVFLILVTLASVITLHFTVRRTGISFMLVDIPIMLGLFYLSPAMVLLVRLAPAAVVQLHRRMSVTKSVFNEAGYAAGIGCASLVLYLYPFGPDDGSRPRTWLILGAAMAAIFVMTMVAVGSVLVLLQGTAAIPQFLHNVAPGAVVAAINVMIGLVVLLTLQASAWAIIPLLALAVVLGVVYRAYSQFLRQHKSLSEMYELTRSISTSGQDGSLADLLLDPIRALMQAESATMWLPAQGRHPEVLLSAQVDYAGLLDSASTPDVLRERATTTGETVAVGPKLGTDNLREHLRVSGVKDAIVVPLRSANVVIGTLEVAGRLGDQFAFGPEDIRLLETIAASAGVAVENSRLVDRLRFDANHDQLTGMPNRRRMIDGLKEAIGGRAPGEVVAVLIFDVVGLRQVNDSLGHAAGDKVLAEVAGRLLAAAPPGALVGRLGGDEFAIEMRAENAEVAVAAAEQIRDRLRGRLEIDSLTVDVDTNVGVAVHPEHSADPAILLQRADVATHAAKSRGAVQLYNPGLESRSVRRLGLAGDLRRALDQGTIEVYYQPKVAMRDRRLVGVECLARWEHPVHGSVAAQDFVAVAEHTGQLGRLTDVVLAEALRRARAWTDAGRSLSVSVNVCPRTFGTPDFAEGVEKLLKEYGVPADRLTLEITEGGVLTDERPMPVLNRLRELGVRLSVDDFGTGQSSPTHLSRLPVQEVKIDRTFVQGMATDPKDLAIVRTVVDMARHFGIAVVAVGVESELTLGLLEEVGCDIGQGFLFSRPLPYERLDAWLQVQTDADPAPPAGEVRWLRAVQ